MGRLKKKKACRIRIALVCIDKTSKHRAIGANRKSPERERERETQTQTPEMLGRKINVCKHANKCIHVHG